MEEAPENSGGAPGPAVERQGGVGGALLGAPLPRTLGPPWVCGVRSAALEVQAVPAKGAGLEVRAEADGMTGRCAPLPRRPFEEAEE